MLTLQQVTTAMQEGYSLAKQFAAANPSAANDKARDNLSALINFPAATQAILDANNANGTVIQ